MIIMEYIKFETAEEAQTFIDKVNRGENIPSSPDAVTQTYCEVEEIEGEFCVIKDEVTSKYI